MSDKNIMNWIREHEGQKSRTDYFDIGNKTQHIVRYDNGDTYQHIEVYEGTMKKIIKRSGFRTYNIIVSDGEQQQQNYFKKG